jgi:hypothetical protein
MFGLIVLLGPASGCGPRQEHRAPLFTGRLEGGTFWQKPVASGGSNEGGGYDKGSRVEVYEDFVVVTTADGLSHVHPLGNCTGLTIKRD